MRRKTDPSRAAVYLSIPLLLGVFFILLPAYPHEKAYSAADNRKGCLVCHEGIEVINEKMQPFLLGFAEQQYGMRDGYECAVCHEGRPSSPEKEAAHQGMIPNPAGMYVLHEGKGCAKCHDETGSITTLQGKPLPKPVGGALAPMTVSSGDPSGKTGINYTYRMARGLMGLETGKANKSLTSNGVTPKGTFLYADFDMDDPDGPVPVAGSDKYKEWVGKALKAGFITRLDKVEEIPDLEKGTRIFGSEEKAAFGDMHRKQCGRCHVWGEGRDKRGDKRAAGCAACHVLYGNDGKYEGSDPTVKNDGKRNHPLMHRITAAVPAAQCTHCHTRGKRIGTTFVGMFEYDYVKDGNAIPFNEKGDPQDQLFTKEYMHVREDVHFERGMNCADCHTSIDIHGDGNIYPVTFYQVEVSCYDCHGTPEKFPWELPVGYGTPVTLDGPRGSLKSGTQEYLLTMKGNAKATWVREGDKAYVVSRYSGKRHAIPLLKEIKLNDRFKTVQGKVAMATIPQHIDKMECYACHATWAPQCFGCHIKYDAKKEGTDWIDSSRKENLDPATGRQTIIKKPGDIAVENRSFMRWESPILGINYKGKVSPLIPGCQVFLTYVNSKGVVTAVNQVNTTSDGLPAPTLAPLQPHSTTLVSRTCEDCHTNPKALGYGGANSRSAGQIQGDEPMFQNLAKGVYGDIEGSKTGKWQVPRIDNYPYALDQLVTRSGKQVQNMPLPQDRPLGKDERNLAEREGVCIACHKYYDTKEWQTIVDRYGKALTPEQHDEMVGRALKGLLK